MQHADGLPSLEGLVLGEELMGEGQEVLLFMRTAHKGSHEQGTERFGKDFKHGYYYP